MELGVSCSRGNILHDDCRACALNPLHPCGLTGDLLELMRGENSWEPDANQYTPSRLLNVCERQRVLQSKNGYYIDIDSLWPTIHGRAIHALLERSRYYPGLMDVIREVRLVTTIDKYSLAASGEFPPATFTGKPDFIGLLREEDGTVFAKIVDYKSTKYIRADFTDPEMDDYTNKHVLQLNMYRYLVERELPTVIGKRVVVEELELLYLDPTRTVRFSSAGNIEYGRKVFKAIPMYPLEQVEQFIIETIEKKRAADITLPDPLPNYPVHWACKRCSVRSLCRQLQEETDSDR